MRTRPGSDAAARGSSVRFAAKGAVDESESLIQHGATADDDGLDRVPFGAGEGLGYHLRPDADGVSKSDSDAWESVHNQAAGA